MPFFGLIFTSSMFLIPTLLAFRKRKTVDMLMNGSLMVSSVAFHSTWHPLVRAFDVTYAHIYASVYLLRRMRSLFYYPKTHLPLNLASICCGCIGATLYYGVSMRSNDLKGNITHMCLHGMVISMMSVFLSST